MKSLNIDIDTTNIIKVSAELDNKATIEQNETEHNMPFICNRCEYSTENKGDLVRHLQKKKICKSIKGDYDRDEYIKTLTERKVNEKHYDCNFCGKAFNSSSNKCNHEKICKSKEKMGKEETMS